MILGREDCVVSPPPACATYGWSGADRTPGEDALSSTSVGRNPANVLPAPVGAISSAERSSRDFASSSSWCSRGLHPRPANHRRKRSGSSAAFSAGEAVMMRGGTAKQVSRCGGFVEGRQQTNLVHRRDHRQLLRDGPVGNIPVLAVEDRDVERLHRRIVIRRIAVGDAIEKIRRVKAR